MKLSTVSAERRDEIEKASGGTISFRVVGGNVTSIQFPGPFGPIFVEVGSYSVTLNEPAKKTKYVVGSFHMVAGEKMFVEKEFDNATDRQIFINTHLSDTQEDELALSTKEVEA